jgi:hypothetical protein
MPMSARFQLSSQLLALLLSQALLPVQDRLRGLRSNSKRTREQVRQVILVALRAAERLGNV